jgi:hypothetical protein
LIPLFAYFGPYEEMRLTLQRHLTGCPG